MIGQLVVLVEIYVDAQEVSLCLGAVFPPPPEGEGRADWWAAFHRGLDAAMKAVWKPHWRWLGSESNYSLYRVGVANAERVTARMVAPMDSAERWSVDVGPENPLDFPARFGFHLEGDCNGQV